MDEPSLIEGGLAVDDRGALGFVNGFGFQGVKRFYVVSNHCPGFVRAWHGHRRESKWVMAVSGCAIVAAVRVDNWDQPAKDLPIHRFVLSAQKPGILHIPKGFANGFMNLTEDAKLMFFSDATVDESRNDDIRFHAHYWDPWAVIER